jgi:transcriptional regulator with XRE-family HTH domain
MPRTYTVETDGQAIKAMRARRLLSQEELAELADLHPQTVSDAETGRRAVSARLVRRLARVLGAEFDDFIQHAETAA